MIKKWLLHLLGSHDWRYNWYDPQPPMRRCWWCGRQEYLKFVDVELYVVEWTEIG